MWQENKESANKWGLIFHLKKVAGLLFPSILGCNISLACFFPEKTTHKFQIEENGETPCTWRTQYYHIYILPIANTMPQKVNSDHPKKNRQLYVRTPMAMSHPRRPSPWVCHIALAWPEHSKSKWSWQHESVNICFKAKSSGKNLFFFYLQLYYCLPANVPVYWFWESAVIIFLSYEFQSLTFSW
jgi:hypothetical protein